MHSMSTYQRAFGVDWQDDALMNGSQRNLMKTTSSTASLRSADRSHSRDSAKSREGSESNRIANVRMRCVAQNKALSVWWKAAIQANIKSRMWMQLGRSPAESMLPPRFERLYQPEKIAQFDRFFARAWATPVRRSHSAQHSKGSSDDETGFRDFRRNISTQRASSQAPQDPYTSESSQESSPHITMALDDFAHSYGLQPLFKPTLKSFVKHYDIKQGNGGVSRRFAGGKRPACY